MPGWLQACSGGVGTGADGPLEGEPKSGVEALALAKRNGRPLLVFVVPEDATRRSNRGQVLGVYLNRASIEGMADLALCGVWCATPTEIRSGLAQDVQVDDATIAVSIETDDGKSGLVAGDPTLEESVYSHAYSVSDVVEQSELRTEMLRTRLHEVIAPDMDTLHRRATQARMTLRPRAGRFGLGAMGDGDEPRTSHVKRVPAWVRWRAENADEKTREKWIAMLSDQAERHWRTSPLPRARWAHSTGCGLEYEDEFDFFKSHMQCGMAFIPEYSSRFLTFLSENE